MSLLPQSGVDENASRDALEESEPATIGFAGNDFGLRGRPRLKGPFSYKPDRFVLGTLFGSQARASEYPSIASVETRNLSSRLPSLTRTGNRDVHTRLHQTSTSSPLGSRTAADRNMLCSTIAPRPIFHARNLGWKPAAGERRKVRVRVPHDCDEKEIAFFRSTESGNRRHAAGRAVSTEIRLKQSLLIGE